MATKGKRLQKVAEKYDRDSFYAVGDAVKIVKDAATDTKFDDTVEIAMNLGVDSRHSDQMVRGTVSLPHGTGKYLLGHLEDNMGRSRRLMGVNRDMLRNWQKHVLPT